MVELQHGPLGLHESTPSLINIVGLKSNDGEEDDIKTHGESRNEWLSPLSLTLAASIINSGLYTQQESRKHVKFFAERIVPMLGQNPISGVEGISRSHWYKSSMTDDHTPFEISYCWRTSNQKNHPIVRYVLDIAPDPGKINRLSSLRQALWAIEILDETRVKSEDYPSLEMFSKLWREVTQALLDYEDRTHQSDCLLCGPSSTFIGFDLKSSQMQAKMYWLLHACATTSKSLSLLDTVFASCTEMSPFYASPKLQTSWSLICDHINSHSSELAPRMLSIDATKYPSPRIKLYVRCSIAQSTSFDDWKKHLTLNDHIPISAEFLSTCGKLWNSLTLPAETTSRQPKYVLILYEISETASSKLYIMCPEIHRPDSFIARQLLKHVQAAKDAKQLEYLASLSEPTAYIAEIGLAPRPVGTEMSIYMNPSLFSKHLWRDWKSDGDVMAKIRDL